MNKEFIKYLAEVEKFLTSNEVGEKTFGEGGCKITVGRTQNGFYTNCIVTNDTTKEDFKKYLDSIDDDIFTEACEYLQNKYGKNVLSVIDNLMKQDEVTPELKTAIKHVKESVKEVAQRKITYLISKYVNADQADKNVIV